MKEKWSQWFSAFLRQTVSISGYVLRAKFEQKTRQARAVRLHTLKRILQENQDTEFGRAHHFDEILASPSMSESYRAAVPLSCYSDYETAIQRMKNGEANVLTARAMAGLVFTSGTTGNAKLIPKVRNGQQFGMLYGMLAGVLTPNLTPKRSYILGKGISLMSYARPQRVPVQERTASTATAAGVQRIAALVPHIWCSPADVFTLKDMTTAHYLHALYGLRDRNVQYIMAVFVSYVLQWLITMEQRWEELVRDVEQGTLTEDLNLPSDVRTRLVAQLSPDPARAAELRQAAADGFVGIVPRIWPHMIRISGVTTGNFAVHVPAIRAYTGDIPFCGAVYAASEGTIGISLQPNSDEYILAPDPAYFEFIPLTEVGKARPQTVLPDALTVGESYELVITNYFGFYRYRLGDIIKIVGYHHQSQKLVFERRKSVQLNLAGEKCTEVHLNTAIDRMAATWLAGSNLHVRDYTFALDTSQSPGRYVLYVELSGNHIPPAVKTSLNENALALDQCLCDANPFLGHFRRVLHVGMPQIKLLKPGSFDLLHEALFVRNPGGNYNQIKTPRYLNDVHLVGLLEGRMLEMSSVRM